MPHAAEHQLSVVQRPLPLCARADVHSVPAQLGKHTTYVLKDPLTLELFQLSEEEFFLWSSLKESTTLSRLQRDFHERFAPRTITYEALQQGLEQLYQQGLLVSNANAQGRQLLQRATKRRRSERWKSFLNLLSIRLGSFDATRLIDRLYEKLSWLFSPLMSLPVVFIVLYAFWILLGHGNEVLARLPAVNEIMQPQYWALWFITIAMVKAFHELAHGLTCKHFGGRCHEMGILLLVLFPCFYCDVTDVWRLPNKWHRIAVSLAGMAAEFLLAAVAVILWWHSEPGLFHIWCLQIAVVCSVGTLLINANPLLRYDGYYILSDLLEIPNLASRSQGRLSLTLRSWLQGEPLPNDPLLSQTQQRILACYTIASRVYLVLVLSAVFLMLLTLARPYRMENLVYTFAGIVMLGLVGFPLTLLWQSMRNPAIRSRLQPVRGALLVFAMTSIITVIVFWPISHSVVGPAALVPAGGETVYATAAGHLRHAVPAGTVVRKGDVIAKLANPELEITLAEYQSEHDSKKLRYNQLRAMRAWDSHASLKLPVAKASFTDAKSQLDQLQRRTEELILRAPRAGTVFAPPEIEPAAGKQSGRLPQWSGSPLDKRNRGCWIEPATLFCTVGTPDQLDALVAVQQHEVSQVQVGDEVRLLLSSAPVRVLTGKVKQVASRTTSTTADNQSMPATKTHLVHVQLDQTNNLPLVGTRGTAKITADHTTVGRLIADYLQRTFRLPW